MEILSFTGWLWLASSSALGEQTQNSGTPWLYRGDEYTAQWG